MCNIPILLSIPRNLDVPIFSINITMVSFNIYKISNIYNNILDILKFMANNPASTPQNHVHVHKAC